jgi:plastocyanin
MFRKRQAVILTVVGLFLAGCTNPGPAAQPSVTFGSDTTPGMSGMPGMSAMPGMSGTPSAPAAPVAGDQVSIDGFAFAPATLTVAAGTTVIWTNRDEEPHTVVANDGSFRSPGMGTGATYSHTFSAPGTFEYVCSIHPMMRGTVVVKP